MSSQIIYGPKQYTEEWYTMRFWDAGRDDPRPKIGASEAGKATGLSEYGTPLHLFAEKRREVPPWEGSFSAEVGSAIEGPILDLAEKHMADVFPDLVEHNKDGKLKTRRNHRVAWRSDNPVVAASCDAILVPKKAGVIDAKATFSIGASTKFGEEGTDEVPVDYILQAQQQCYVQGVETCYFPVLFFLGNGPMLKCYRVHRQERIVEAIIDAENELAERIVNNDPPEPNWEHRHTPDLVKQLSKIVDGKTIDLDGSAAQYWERSEKIGKLVTKLNKRRDELKARVLHLMDGAAIGVLPDGTREIVQREYEEKLWTDRDIPAAGDVKRKSYTTLTSRKRKS